MSLGALQVGLLLGGLRPAGVLGALAERAELLGFDSLWMGDHVAFPAPILDPLQGLACFAAHTQRVRIGTCVYLLPLRHPTVVAKAVASLDYISDGRVVFGVGVGGEFPGEFQACEVPVAERGARTDEAIGILRALWQSSSAAQRGRFYSIPPVHIAPRPAQHGGPPIWVGGRRGRSLRRAALLGDGFVGHFLTPDGFAERMAEIRSIAQDAGRARPITAAHLVFAHVAASRGAALERAAAVLGAMYGRDMGRAAERYVVLGTAADCQRTVREYAAAGVEHLILSPLAFGDDVEEQIDALARALGRA